MDNQPEEPREATPVKSEQGGEQTLRRIRRRKLRWLLLKMVLLVIVLVLGLVVYMQSSHALRHLILPAVGRKLGTEVTAAGGGVSLGGRLRLEQPVIYGTDGEPAFGAEAVLVEIVPRSIFGGNQPHINQVVVREPKVRVRVAKDGSTNWDLPGLQKEDEEKDPQPLPDIALDRVEVTGLALDLETATGLTALIEDANLELADFGHGKKSEFALDAKGRMARPEMELE